jgi:uncharacterized membrane protein YhaH (DUF805 family)
MSFTEAIRSVYRNYFKFSGRASRPEWWWFFLFAMVVYIGFVVLTVAAYPDVRGPSDGLWGVVLLGMIVFWLVSLVPYVAVTVRRLHDQDRSGWWLLLALVPFGGLVLFILMMLEGTPGLNRYGPPTNDPSGGVRHMRYTGLSQEEVMASYRTDAARAAAYNFWPTREQRSMDGSTFVLDVTYGWMTTGPAWVAPAWVAPGMPTASQNKLGR